MPHDDMSRPEGLSARGVWHWKQAACADVPAGMESVTPRRSGLWQVAQDWRAADPLPTCVAWSKLTLKVRKGGKGLSAPVCVFVWQMVQMGLD